MNSICNKVPTLAKLSMQIETDEMAAWLTTSLYIEEKPVELVQNEPVINDNALVRPDTSLC